MLAAPRSLFGALVDDAALFPPGNAPMDVALRAHAQHRAASYGEMVGPFLCPVSRVDEMAAALPDDQQVELSLVVDVTGEASHHALRQAATDPRLTLVAVEAAHARLGTDAAVVGENMLRLPTAVGYLEVARTGFGEALDLVARGGWRAAKYRTGGMGAGDFPSERELAEFIVACASRGIPFKLTAGLHHAVRNTAADTGFEQHGLLNTLVATAGARAGADAGSTALVLGSRDGGALAATVQGWSEPDALDVRRLLRSVGCCGVTDPLDELAELGLLPTPSQGGA
jgi:hypothetical protein